MRIDSAQNFLRWARVFLHFFERFELIVSHFSTSRKILEISTIENEQILGSRTHLTLLLLIGREYSN